MKRPPVYSFFIGFNAIVAAYELLLFPAFTQTAQFEQLIPLIPVNPTIFISFGISKGVYSLVMAYGLFSRKSWIYYGLVGGNALLILASLLLSSSLSLAPFALVMIAFYTYFFRKEDFQHYLQESMDSTEDHPTDLSKTFEDSPLSDERIVSKKKEISSHPSFPIAFYSVLGLSGYFLFSALSVLITVSLSSIFMLFYVVGFVIISIGLFWGSMKLRPNKELSWHGYAGKLLVVVGAIGIFFGFILSSASNQPEMVKILEETNSAIAPSMGIWLMAYGTFLGLVGYPLMKATDQESEE